MNIEQCIERSKQIPRTQHEQGYIDAICWLLQELEKRPVVVEQNANATDMNELHGEAHGVDWVYPAPSAPEGWQQFSHTLKYLIGTWRDGKGMFPQESDKYNESIAAAHLLLKEADWQQDR